MISAESLGEVRVTKKTKPYLSYHVDFPASSSRLKLEVRIQTDGQFMVGWFPGWVHQDDVPELAQLLLTADKIIKEEG